MFWNRKKETDAVIDNAKNDALELCYTDKMGRQYYKWRNPLLIPTMRYLVGWSAIEYANMGVTAKEAVEHLDKAIDAINGSNLANAAYYVTSFKNRILSADPEKAYLELSAVYILLRNENPKEYNTSLAATKVAIWQQDLDAKAFFLNFAFRTSATLTKDLKENTPTVLTTSLLQTLKLLSLTLPKESTKGSTN